MTLVHFSTNPFSDGRKKWLCFPSGWLFSLPLACALGEAEVDCLLNNPSITAVACSN
jgi:hypothetical protein